jgi:hypothetical protein
MIGAEIAGRSRAALIAGLSMAMSACGGRAAIDDSSDEGKPAAGFYSVQTTTSDDTCGLPELNGMTEQLVFAADTGINFSIWPITRQDVPWSGLPDTEGGQCGASVAVTLSEVTSRHFVADETWNWQDPSTCSAVTFKVLPSAPCALKMRLAFDLFAACPTTVNGASCQ